jgi:sec-independent protein translocase protein TatA
MNSVIFAWLNGWEIVLIFAVILVLFGAKKLPELARGLGQGIREFKKSTREVQEEIEAAMDVEAPPTRPKRLPPETQARTTEQVEQPASESPKS